MRRAGPGHDGENKARTVERHGAAQRAPKRKRHHVENNSGASMATKAREIGLAQKPAQKPKAEGGAARSAGPRVAIIIPNIETCIPCFGETVWHSTSECHCSAGWKAARVASGNENINNAWCVWFPLQGRRETQTPWLRTCFEDDDGFDLTGLLNFRVLKAKNERVLYVFRASWRQHCCLDPSRMLSVSWHTISKRRWDNRRLREEEGGQTGSEGKRAFEEALRNKSQMMVETVVRKE